MTHQDKAISFHFEREFCLKELKVWQNEGSSLFQVGSLKSSLPAMR